MPENSSLAGLPADHIVRRMANILLASPRPGDRLHRPPHPGRRPSRQVGCPIGLQAIGRCWHEHNLLRLAHAAERAVERRTPRTSYRLIG